MQNKIAIGTVQFGLDYGISNKTGEVSQNEIKKILFAAADLGIDTIDTALAYGKSQQKLGKEDLSQFQVVSKLLALENIVSDFDTVLNELNLESIYGLMVHNFEKFKTTTTSFDLFRQLKIESKVQKVGFSLNSLKELEYLFDRNINFDIIQLPYNLFDTRFEVYFEELKARGIEVHSRSTFLQGLFFLNPTQLNDHLKPLQSSIYALQDLAFQNEMSISELALKFVLSNPYISKVVIGLESESQLRQNLIGLDSFESFDNLKHDLNKLASNDEFLVLPMHWK
ncbi:MAG: aldo/keto reductase [Crocinitomicaceae bacterium]